MNWSNADIIKNFNGVVRDTKLLTTEELEAKYADFRKDFEPIYNKAIDSVVNNRVQESHEMLQMMLKARENMNSGKVSKLHTDMFVGNQLGNKYIYPKTNVPSGEDYKQAIDTIKQKIKENEEEERKQKEEEKKQDDTYSKYEYTLPDKSVD
jgi:hypothetical protein